MQGYIAGTLFFSFTFLILYVYHLHKRLLMAALHFNENYCRKQAVTASGAERIRIVYPKQKEGEYTPKPVPVAKTYSKLVII